ncbi:hypothetical protein C4572_03485 [Candidatus Parcubacteria bacterium]|nr:MAG: hypothetical protein C4572_03485 [Candidatus Parcubacteria bacterium]
MLRIYFKKSLWKTQPTFRVEDNQAGWKSFPQAAGSTLLETVIYSAILALVAALTAQSFLAMSKTYASIRATRAVNISTVSAMERIIREIRLADTIDEAGSILSNDTGKLRIIAGASSTEFSLIGSDVYISENGGSFDPLTSSSSEILLMRFDKITASGTSKALRVTMETRAKVGHIQKQEKFYNTAVLRGSY